MTSHIPRSEWCGELRESDVLFPAPPSVRRWHVRRWAFEVGRSEFNVRRSTFVLSPVHAAHRLSSSRFASAFHLPAPPNPPFPPPRPSSISTARTATWTCRRTCSPTKWLPWKAGSSGGRSVITPRFFEFGDAALMIGILNFGTSSEITIQRVSNRAYNVAKRWTGRR